MLQYRTIGLHVPRQTAAAARCKGAARLHVGRRTLRGGPGV